MRTSRIMDLFVAQRAGFKNVGFTQKDLQNKLNDHFMKEIETTDVKVALCYLRAKGQMDNGLFSGIVWMMRIGCIIYFGLILCLGLITQRLVMFGASYCKNMY